MISVVQILLWGAVFLAISPVQAQDFSYGEYKANALVPLFADNVRVRKGPATSSEVLATLPIGTQVHLVSKATETLLVNGYRQNWYRMRLPIEEKPVEGYVWGGFVALDYDTLRNGDLLVGITEHQEGGWKGEARLVEHGRIVARTPLDIVNTPLGVPDSYGYTVKLSSTTVPGFPQFKAAFQLRYIYEACGYTNADALIFWDGKKLSAGPIACHVSEAGIFHVESEFLFPGQEGCPKNQIWVKTTSAEEEKEKPEIRYTKYSWDGTTWTELPQAGTE